MGFIRKFFYFFIEIIIFIFFLAILLSRSSLLPDTSKLYSTSTAFRLQTDSFLHGHLYLSPYPFGYHLDFNWIGGHGLQQNWGLGVPLLRLPFEWISAQFGFGPFPDKVTLIFYLTFTIILLNMSLMKVMKSLEVSPPSAIRLLIRWYLIAWIFFSPAMGGLIQKHMNVYNETVFYGCLYVYVLLSLFWFYMTNPNDRDFFILCLLAGLACLIRPTLIFYGLAIGAAASLYAYQDKRNIFLIVIGIFCFSLGVAINLGGNYLRFGSILDFGHQESLTGSHLLIYTMHFGSPFHKEHFLSAAKELVGELFFNNPWQSHEFRWREVGHSSPFSITHLIILALGLILYVFFLLSKSLKQINSKLISFSLAWGLFSCGSLFIFYSKATSIAPRYLSEFSVSINIIFIVLILLSFSYINSYLRNNKFLILFIILLGVLFYVTNNKFFEFDNRSVNKYYQGQFTDKDGAKKLVDKFDHDLLLRPYLPKTSYCRQSYSTTGLRFQYMGWDIHKDCLVSVATSAILPSKRCVVLNYAIKEDQQKPDVQVKRDSIFLKLADSQMTVKNAKGYNQVQMTQSFCSDVPITNAISLYSIGWAAIDQLSKVRNGKLPIKLNWFSVAEQ